MSSFIVVEVPATSANLGPGFDCLGMALDLWNRFEISVGGDMLEIACEGEGAQDIPKNQQNLLCKSMRLGLAGEKRLSGLRVRSMNNIPVYSGLGSSATAIVGGLLAASALRKKPLEKEELLDLAATIEGHPDNVAPAIFGGFVASAVADSGRVEAVTLPVPPEVRIVVAVPRLKLETRESRGLLPVSVSMESATYNLSRTALWVAAVARGELEMLRTATRDALHQDSRSKLVPGFRSVLQAAMEAGALGAALSGSGPSVVAFARESSTDTVRDAMRVGFSRAGVDTRVLVTRPAPTGARLILPDISDKP